MGVLPDYKEWIELAKKAGNVEAQEQIMQLREEHLQLREENLQLREEKRRLKEQIEAAATMKFEMPYYWKETATGRDGPFCQVCHDDSSKLVRLQSRKQGHGAWDCRVCHTYFTDKNYSEPAFNSVVKFGSWMGV